MSLLSQFEQPLPIVKCSVEKITVETQGKYEGAFLIRNAGGGDLSGEITSNSQAIKFDPEKFEGNKNEISYSVDLSIYKIGDIIQTTALITSNGGEFVIPVILKMTPPAIVTKEKEKIASLKDFLWYAKTYPVPARQLFTQTEFMMWLFGMNYDNMELYEHFVSDPNKERAVDNFLIINKLKKKSAPVLLDDSITINIPSYSKEIITGVIPLKRNGWGYIELSLSLEPAYPWITLFKDKLTSQDFDDEGYCSIDFLINPSKLFSIRDSVKFRITSSSGECYELPLTTIVRPPYSAKLNKQSFVYEDSGHVLIENYKGGELIVDVSTNCPHIKFEGAQYSIRDKTARIPFNVKVNAVASVQQRWLKKQNIINGKICITVDRRLFVLGMGAKLTEELPFVIAKPIE